ncbi:MAG TPA: type II toxin-antitoxin system MqsA family antitoxin, partial [Anaerolineales bacterium]|nr:type II toxin-antitoxin system MqsA family antitoxin [Anaerolineales bacterium]
MICLICRQAEIVEGLTAISLQRGELRLEIENVPARICPRCGEAFVDEDIAMRLLQSAENASRAGILADS